MIEEYVCKARLRNLKDNKTYFYKISAESSCNVNLDPDMIQRYFDFEHNSLCGVVDYGAAKWILKGCIQENKDKFCDPGYEHKYDCHWHYPFNKAGVEWLENNLKNTTKQWKFYTQHYCPWSDAEYAYQNGKEPAVAQRQQLWPILMKYNVRVATSGHCHVYQRTYQIDKDGNKDPKGVYSLDPVGQCHIRVAESPYMAVFYNKYDGSSNPVGVKGQQGWYGITYLMVTGTNGICEAFNAHKTLNYRKDDSFTFGISSSR